MDCSGLKKNGADDIYLKLTAETGSYAVPYIVGKTGDTENWAHRFPEYRVNLAKFEYSCYQDTITLLGFDNLQDTLYIADEFFQIHDYAFGNTDEAFED